MPQGLQHSVHEHLYNLDCATHKNYPRRSRVKANLKLTAIDNRDFKLMSRVKVKY